MSSPAIPKAKSLIPLSAVPQDPLFGGLRLVRCQSDDKARAAYSQRAYDFQHRSIDLHEIPGVVLAAKGAPQSYRLTATIHCTLAEFVEYVRYDPSDPPIEDYDALQMQEAHAQTQSDFKNAKARNLGDFRQYNLEAIRGDRRAYLPTVSAWQTETVFDDTVFVAFDENKPLALYGTLFLPKKPVMQSDGQTQAAALFKTAQSGAAQGAGALAQFTVSLEIELKVDPAGAAQSFADRNGRGTTKNKNLVALYDSSSAMAQLRQRAVKDTVFESRLADGRGQGTGMLQTENIVDLSTLQQMLLGVVSGGLAKPEHVKHYHLDALVPHCRRFLKMLDDEFSHHWTASPSKDQDPFRVKYIHGWAFALKALALAFHDANKAELVPLHEAMVAGLKDEHATVAKARAAFDGAVAAASKSATEGTPSLTEEDLRTRLAAIDWHRQRAHWIAITGAKTDRRGRVRVRTLKDGTEVVDAQAQNTAAVINATRNRIVGHEWEELTSTTDQPLPKRRAA